MEDQGATPLLWLVPTRGRPEAAAELALTHRRNGECSDMLFLVDEDDPSLPGYLRHPGFDVTVRASAGLGCGPTLNDAARHYAQGYTHLGFMGDDHRPRTMGFDRRLVEAAGSFGLSYGNDLFLGEKLPTAVVMSADIVRTLGWMAPPGLHHLFLDDFWLQLGTDLGAITYLDDVVIEHLHPSAGKAEWDDAYRRVNSPEMHTHDHTEWVRYHAEGEYAADLARLREAREGASVG